MNSVCPICDVGITLNQDVEESEIIACSDCQSRLVVASVKKERVVLDKAPEVEEDWGE